MTFRHSFLLPPLTAVSLACVASVAFAQTHGAAFAANLASSTEQIASIDPAVPPAAGKPCVVELFNDRPWPQEYVYIENDPSYSYTPPAACPPPWSKIILKLDMQSTRRTVVDTLGMDLANVRLFHGATPHYDGVVNWHVERDLTDYGALFKQPQIGLLWSSQNPEAIDYVTDSFAFHAHAELLFYRSSAATPPPRVPDVVIGISADAPVALPHNIVRAYMDVETDAQNNPYWYTCYADDVGGLPLTEFVAPGGAPKISLHPPLQGCGGGNFREIKIGVDGTPAGIAPAFPLIVADMNWTAHNSADQPITTPELLNFKPYRVDLTPFAAVLSAPGTHTVAADNGGSTLLLYLDPHRSQVSGAVTLNTLATENGAATDTDTLKQSGNTILGTINTQEHRDFEIRGFVLGSSGRIDSRVHQIDDFASTQFFHLIGPQIPNITAHKLYNQNLSMRNSVQQVSSRKIGNRVIARERIHVQYPLDMVYYMETVQTVMDGFDIEFLNTNITFKQARVIDQDHWRQTLGHFSSHVHDRFYSIRTGGDQQPDPQWHSFTARNYRDTEGSCYKASMASQNGSITGTTYGQGCPGDRNWVIWFAHPDGSPGPVSW